MEEEASATVARVLENGCWRARKKERMARNGVLWAVRGCWVKRAKGKRCKGFERKREISTKRRHVQLVPYVLGWAVSAPK